LVARGPIRRSFRSEGKSEVGQIQHLTGIRNSRIIVAVNNDPKAPIFEYSDYNVVADLYEFIPALIDAVKQLGKA
jgi:electron transfer flavoprotein alpha subunit